MISPKKPSKNFVFFAAVPFILLLFVFALFYNQSREAVSAAKNEMTCQSEIPIGQAVDEAEDIARKTITNVNTVINSSRSQIAAAEELLGDLTDPSQCVVGNCGTSCNKVCTEVEVEENGKIVTQEQCDCVVTSPCTGGPCPGSKPAYDQILEKFKQIDKSYKTIETAYKDMEGVISKKYPVEFIPLIFAPETTLVPIEETKREQAFEKLRTSREEAEKCYSLGSALGQFSAGKTGGASLFSCKSAQQFGLPLPSARFLGEKFPCYGPTQNNPERSENYFCCQ